MPGFSLKDQQAKANAENTPYTMPVDGIDGRPLTHGEGNKRPVTISVLGVHSDAHRAAEAEINDRRVRPRQMTQAGFFDQGIEKAAACVTGWDGFYEDEDGTVPLRCDPHNVKTLFKACDWLYQQVVEAMNDHALFSQSSSN